jgi:methionyl-tRNA formyltransferase
MKLAFMGTPENSARVLEELYKNSYQISWVLTQPDRPYGRGKTLKAPAVKSKAEELALTVLQSEKFDRSLFERIKKFERPDLAIVVAYGSYVPSYFLDYPKYGCLNIHFSLLPKYRGSAPVARAIMDNQNKTGISIMNLAKEMDAGDILSQREVQITCYDTSESLTSKLTEEGIKLLLDTIPGYVDGKIKPVSQASTGIEPSYAKKISSDERYIDWNDSAQSINNKVRALYPWPCAESKIEGLVLKITRCGVKKDIESNAVGFSNGTVINVDKKQGFIEVKTALGSVLLEKVQVSGKREMLVSEFLNGHNIKNGMRFEPCIK